MNRGLRAGIPAFYSAAILIGFLINTRAGVIIAIGGAVVCAGLYSIISRTSATPASARRPPRQRNRGR